MNDFYDEELGNVLIKKHGRAKRVLARRMNNHVQLTVPSKMPKDEILIIFQRLKPKILAAPQLKIIKVDENSSFRTSTFSVSITRHPISRTNIKMTLDKGVLTINVPPHFDIYKENIQQIIREMIVTALRHEAKRVLPQKVLSYAKKFNLTVREVKINNSKHRWGSCTGRKNINLSLFLLMLPEELIEYVILHELAHTIELNHSVRFWEVLNKMYGRNIDDLDKKVTYWNSDYITFLKQ